MVVQPADANVRRDRRPAKPTSVMVLAMVMLVFGFVGLFQAMDSNVPSGVVVPLLALALFTMISGVLLMGPRIGWYLGMTVASLYLVRTVALAAWYIGSTQIEPGVSVFMVLAVLPGLFVAVLAIMILMNPVARASYGIGSA